MVLVSVFALALSASAQPYDERFGGGPQDDSDIFYGQQQPPQQQDQFGQWNPNPNQGNGIGPSVPPYNPNPGPTGVPLNGNNGNLDDDIFGAPNKMEAQAPPNRGFARPPGYNNSAQALGNFNEQMLVQQMNQAADRFATIPFNQQQAYYYQYMREGIWMMASGSPALRRESQQILRTKIYPRVPTGSPLVPMLDDTWNLAERGANRGPQGPGYGLNGFESWEQPDQLNNDQFNPDAPVAANRPTLNVHARSRFTGNMAPGQAATNSQIMGGPPKGPAPKDAPPRGTQSNAPATKPVLKNGRCNPGRTPQPGEIVNCQ